MTQQHLLDFSIETCVRCTLYKIQSKYICTLLTTYYKDDMSVEVTEFGSYWLSIAGIFGKKKHQNHFFSSS